MNSHATTRLDEQAKPSLHAHVYETLAFLQSYYGEHSLLPDHSDVVTVCFLGNSDFGKSRLLDALVVDTEQQLGIYPATAVSPAHPEVPNKRDCGGLIFSHYRAQGLHPTRLAGVLSTRYSEKVRILLSG